ncbi:MAG: hypothetical protein V1728_00940, partial [Candidatus Micrarchaeota archaeon]
MIFAVGSSENGEFPDLSGIRASAGPPARSSRRTRKEASAQAGPDYGTPSDSSRASSRASPAYSAALPSPSFSALVSDAKAIEKRAPATPATSLPPLSPDTAITVGAYDARLNETTFFEASVLAKKIDNPRASVLSRDSSRGAGSSPYAGPSSDSGMPSAPASVVFTPLRADSALLPDSALGAPRPTSVPSPSMPSAPRPPYSYSPPRSSLPSELSIPPMPRPSAPSAPRSVPAAPSVPHSSMSSAYVRPPPPLPSMPPAPPPDEPEAARPSYSKPPSIPASTPDEPDVESREEDAGEGRPPAGEPVPSSYERSTGSRSSS